MVDFEKPKLPTDGMEQDEDTPEVKEVPVGKKFYRIDRNGNIEFLDSPYKVPETDPNAEK